MKSDEILKYQVALEVIRNDSVGDWIHDPWGMPELDWIVSQPQQLEGHLRHRRKPGFFSTFTVIKENFGIRPAVLFQPFDRLVFESSMLPRLARLTADLPEAVCGYRWDSSNNVYVDNGKEWKRYRERLRALCLSHSLVLKTDISSFFGSIPNEVLKSQLESHLADASEGEQRRNSQRVITWLESYWNKPNRRGLPQRYWASNVLANLFLMNLDIALGHIFPSIPYARWVDDYVFFCNDSAEARHLQIWLAEQLHELGLSLNLAKTILFEDQSAKEYYKNVDHTELEKDISGSDVGSKLDPIITEINNEPHLVRRTDVKFFLKLARKRDLEEFARIFVDKTGSLLHASDLLANSFAYFGLWSDCQDWFVEFSKGPLAKCSWALGQLIRMFPANTAPSKAVVERVAELVNSGTYAERVSGLFLLSRWDKAHARSVLRDSSANFQSHDDLRLAAMLGCEIREEKNWIRRLVAQSDELAVLAEYLSDRDFAPSKVHGYHIVSPREEHPDSIY